MHLFNFSRWPVFTAVSLFSQLPFAQELTPQTNTFASDVQLTQDQKLSAGINDTVAKSIEISLNFERSNWANGSVDDDPFYRVPSNASNAPPGSLLKLQVNANTSAYTLPPNTALSRLLFQTETLNGSTVPASAYVLWPYTPRDEGDGYPVIGWAHGTSGVFGNCAPSHIRNLWYQFTVPFTLALQGYVVVAPDYAGLGVHQDAGGNRFRHAYLGSPAGANDLFYSVQAAQTAFSVLSKRFLLMGHSQGGGVAWAAAQRQASKPVDGYLGAIAGSPVTDMYDLVQTSLNAPALGMLIANGLPDIFPSFDASAFLTPNGLNVYRLISEIQGCNSVALPSFADPSLSQPEWYNDFYAQRYFDLVSNGGKVVAGPLLVIQGDADPVVLPNLTDHAVNVTCAQYPLSQIQYLIYAGATHTPVMYANQRAWLEWIADRFAGKETPTSCSTSKVSSARPYDDYQAEANWFIEYATAPYEVA